MSKYYIRAGIKGRDLQWREVDGERVEVVDWLGTFIYEDEDQDVQGHDGTFPVYNICELRTGYRIAYSVVSKEEAIEKARQALAKRSVGPVLRLLENIFRKQGPSPFYKGD